MNVVNKDVVATPAAAEYDVIRDVGAPDKVYYNTTIDVKRHAASAAASENPRSAASAVYADMANVYENPALISDVAPAQKARLTEVPDTTADVHNREEYLDLVEMTPVTESNTYESLDARERTAAASGNSADANPYAPLSL